MRRIFSKALWLSAVIFAVTSTAAPSGGHAQQETEDEFQEVEEDPVSRGEAAPRDRGEIEQGTDGKYYTEDGVPTYNITEDGRVDWYTFSGFRRYHAECHQCHGPEGLGSTYAPALVRSLQRLSYEDFLEVVVNGRVAGNSVMPSFGSNLNVMCFIDDLYIYLTARADGALGRGRPGNREDKPDAATQAEHACFGN